jgi:hypothetical protein
VCLSSAGEAEHQLYVLEAIIVELKVGVLIHLVCIQRDHSGGSMSQVLRVWEAFGFSCCRQWRVIKDNTSIESIKEVV